ncbi:MAG TPA: hypothetical protein VN428_10550 [Bryobacteraceae bacterium]|nr:hypothetical protein [Bryobacteraceae bacterium]
MNQIGGLLSKYTGSPEEHQQEAERDFDQVSQNAPRQSLASGIDEVFRSNQTPAFGQLMGQMFSNANSHQKAGILNQLLSSGAGGAIASQFLGGKRQVSPEDAEQVPPDQVQKMAETAEQQDQGIVDKLSDFYSEHPTLVKSLGAGALAILMSKMAGGRGRGGGIGSLF